VLKLWKKKWDNLTSERGVVGVEGGGIWGGGVPPVD